MANLTTLAASSSVVITVTEQQSIVLNNGRTDKARLQITTGPNAGAVVADNHLGRRVYGPFGAGTITLTAIVGDVRYELSGDDESPLGDDYEFTSAQSDSLRALVSGDGTPVYVGPWAGRPASSSVPVGTQIYITDIPAGGRTVFYAGATVWYPEGGEVVLASSGIAKASVTGTTSATSQTLMTIPGGIIGPNGSLIVEGHYSMTNNANSKSLQFSASTGNVRLYSAAATSVGQVVFRATMTNRGSEVQQIVQENTFAGAGSATGTPHIGAQDTTLDWTLRNLMQLAVAGDTVTLERWAVVARPF